MRYYILGGADNKMPVQASLMEWAQFFENQDRAVAQIQISKKTWVILRGFLCPIFIMICWFLFLSTFEPIGLTLNFLRGVAVGSLGYVCGRLLCDAFSSERREGATRISTVFLGLDHRFVGQGPPILFESLVFDGPYADLMARYCTLREAEKGHAKIEKTIMEAMNKEDYDIRPGN